MREHRGHFQTAPTWWALAAGALYSRRFGPGRATSFRDPVRAFFPAVSLLRAIEREMEMDREMEMERERERETERQGHGYGYGYGHGHGLLAYE